MLNAIKMKIVNGRLQRPEHKEVTSGGDVTQNRIIDSLWEECKSFNEELKGAISDTISLDNSEFQSVRTESKRKFFFFKEDVEVLGPVSVPDQAKEVGTVVINYLDEALPSGRHLYGVDSLEYVPDSIDLDGPAEELPQGVKKLEEVVVAEKSPFGVYTNALRGYSLETPGHWKRRNICFRFEDRTSYSTDRLTINAAGTEATYTSGDWETEVRETIEYDYSSTDSSSSIFDDEIM